MADLHTLSRLDPSAFGLLFAFVASFGLSGKCVYDLIFGRLGSSRFSSGIWIERSMTVLATLVTSILAVDTMLHPEFHELGVPTFVMSIPIVASVVGSFLLNARYNELHLPRPQILRSPIVWTMLFCSLGSTQWSAHRFYEIVTAIPDSERILPLIPPGSQQPLTRWIARTDRGTELPLYHWEVEPTEFRNYAAVTDGNLADTFEAIPRAPANERSNCHGWVFTGGQFLMVGSSVEVLLDENDYVLVTAPQADDVVIYRNSSGGIVHSGLVRGVLSDGTVIVESKWGVDGRFLHEPKDQPYGENYSFYRSPRNGHLVDLQRRPSGP